MTADHPPAPGRRRSHVRSTIARARVADEVALEGSAELRGASRIPTLHGLTVRRSDLREDLAAEAAFGCSVPRVLPNWPAGTVTILSTSGEEPHAIPVSAALRAGPDRVLIALAAGRESLARLRADPRVAVAILSEGDVALTAYGNARVIQEDLVDGVVGVEIEVERVQNHGRDTFMIEAGVRWRWTDPAAQARDAEVRAALERLAQQ